MPVPPRRDWSARGDSNPDLHGLNVPRLPIAPRAEMMVPPGGLEPPPSGLRARHAAFTLQRGNGANDGIRTRTSRLGRPAGDRYPTLALGSAYGSGRPNRLTSLGCQRTHSRRVGGWQGIRTQSPPMGERGYNPPADHPPVPPVLATAPGFEPGSASFGGSDASLAPRCRSNRPSRRQNPPVTVPSLLSERPANKKRPSRGSP